MELITGFLIKYGIELAIGSIGTFVLGWILKKIPFDKLAKWAESIGAKQGEAITKFFNSKLPKLWNSVIEPIFIDTIHALFFAWVRGFIAGLKSDNPESEKKEAETK